MEKYISEFKNLIKEWDFKKNTLNPKTTSELSSKKAWWVCIKEHSYESVIRNRTKLNTGCPYCAGVKVLKGFNDLESNYPNIAKEWDYEKNCLNPGKISQYSNKKIWWICPKNHSYENVLCTRTKNGVNCPICAGKKILSGFNDLKTLNPKLALEWDYERNKEVPDNISLGSNKKFWWICQKSKNHNHSYECSPSNRKFGKNCPYCANQKIILGFNDLVTTNPEKAQLWDHKNNKRTPQEVTAGTEKTFNWKCIKGHSFEKTVKKVVIAKTPCPYCNNLKIKEGYNDLRTTHKKLVDTEWDYNKNTILPTEISKSYRKKIYWICKNNHSFKNSPLTRIGQNIGCPICSNNLIIPGVNDLKTVFPLTATLLDEKKSKVKSSEIAPQAKRKCWWKCKKGHNWEKTVMSMSVNNKCPYCSNKKLLIGFNDLETKTPELKKLWSLKNNITISNVLCSSGSLYIWECSLGHEWNRKIGEMKRNKICPFCSNRKIYPGFNDLKTLFPKLSKEFDSTKNKADLNTLSPNSNKKIWWKCKKGHSWKSVVSSRTGKNKCGCPYCSNKKVLKGYNDLNTIYPDLAKELIVDKTGFSSYEISSHSGKRAYWKCSKCSHEWITDIYTRTKMGCSCPKCGMGNVSKLEIDLSEYIQQILPQDTEIITNSRQIIKPYELDIYIPELRKAVEFNGDYWHSDTIIRKTKGISAKDYHQQKMKLCNDNNIDLVFVWESDWLNNSEIVKKDLRNFLLNDFVNDSLIQLEKSFRIFEEI